MLLQVQNLTRKFGGVTAVDDVSFTVTQGTITALIGPNGAGKTTVFNLITGILKPCVGNIYFADQNISGLKPYQIAKAGITRTYQNLQLFNRMTVLENVMTGAYLKGQTGFIRSIFRPPGRCAEDKLIKKQALELLDDVGLSAVVHLPAATLTFGQQRLLEIARALACQPQLILLDEPAAGLNDSETKDLAVFLKKLRHSGLTMVLVEHDMETVMEVADHILVLNFGQDIAQGTPAAIQTNLEVIKAYLGEDDLIA